MNYFTIHQQISHFLLPIGNNSQIHPHEHVHSQFDLLTNLNYHFIQHNLRGLNQITHSRNCSLKPVKMKLFESDLG